MLLSGQVKNSSPYVHVIYIHVYECDRHSGFDFYVYTLMYVYSMLVIIMMVQCACCILIPHSSGV